MWSSMSENWGGTILHSVFASFLKNISYLALKK
jgi:hypothetical protein